MALNSEQARRLGRCKKVGLTKVERKQLISSLKKHALDGDVQSAIALGLFELNNKQSLLDPKK